MTDVIQLRRADTGASWVTVGSWTDARGFLAARFDAFGIDDVRLRECRPRDEEFGRRRSVRDGLARLRGRLYTRPVGTVLSITDADDAYPAWRVRRMTPGLPEREPTFPGYPLEQWVPELQTILRKVAAFDPGTRCNGGAYTRRIEGTTIWSRHSKRRNRGCRGEAADLTWPLPAPIGNDLPRQRRAVAWMRAHGDDLGLGYVISERTSYHWTDDFDGRYYGGVAHVSHAHIEPRVLDDGPVCY